MKFGLWMDEARKLGADRLATGHYVSLAEHPRYGMALHQGADEAKDQSYFLCQLSQEQLRYDPEGNADGRKPGDEATEAIRCTPTHVTQANK